MESPLKVVDSTKLVLIADTLLKVDVHSSVSGAEVSVESITDVRQGDVLGPMLFVLYMAALTML